MLKINNLDFNINGNQIFHSLNLEIAKGEIHALMGPNGVGKTTLVKLILAHPDYLNYKGDIIFEETNLKDKTTDQIASLGIYSIFQNPPEIKGVKYLDLLRSSTNEFHKTSIFDFMKQITSSLKKLNMDDSYLKREVNVNLSGGEKKKCEILALNMIQPKLLILDEIDSGLDVDSLKEVSTFINQYLKENKETSILIITHYPRILKYLKPDYVHILKDGHIVKTGNYNLALEIEEKGYEEK